MRVAVVLAAVLVLWPAPAVAADFGGGRAPDTVVTLRTVADGVVVRAHVLARCGTGAVRRRVPLAADGSFSLSATVTGPAPDDRRVRRIARLTVAGRIVGSTATGTAQVRLTFRRDGRVVGRCATGERRWRAGSGYYGVTNDDFRRPRAVLLDLHGSRLTTAVFEYLWPCRRSGASERINVTPGGRIAADGTFALRERFTLRFADARERFRVNVRGRFTGTRALGWISVSSVARSLAGRVIDRCRTGAISFDVAA